MLGKSHTTTAWWRLAATESRKGGSGGGFAMTVDDNPKRQPYGCWRQHPTYTTSIHQEQRNRGEGEVAGRLTSDSDHSRISQQHYSLVVGLGSQLDCTNRFR